MGLARDEPVGRVATPGRAISLRVVSFEPERERLTLSILHADGARIAPEEAQGRVDLAALANELGAEPPGSGLGKLLREALGRAERDRGEGAA